MSAREVSGGPPMHYRYRCGIEKRTKRGRTLWRFVGEYKHISWQLHGAGFSGKSSRWMDDRAKVVAAANAWLDSRDYQTPDLEYV